MGLAPQGFPLGLVIAFLFLTIIVIFMENAKQTIGTSGSGGISLGSVLMVDYF